MSRAPSEALVSPGDAAANAVSVFVQGAVGVAKKHPKITSTWAFGLALMVLGTGFTVSQSLRADYEDSMERVDADYSNTLSGLQRSWAQADARYRQSQGWFWSCDRVCQRAKLDADDARRALDGVLAQERAAVSDIKSRVGVMSLYGVQEARDLFWGTFTGGKKFAQRQSMWDLLFMGLNSTRRDENMLGVILKWVIQLLFNFTLGLCGALVVFVCKLWSVITTYQARITARRGARAIHARHASERSRPSQADPITGFAFWLLAVITAGSFVASYLLLMYGAAATSAVGIAAAAQAQARIEGTQRGGRRQQYVQGRAHFD